MDIITDINIINNHFVDVNEMAVDNHIAHVRNMVVDKFGIVL